jgi:GNAT superfamily N-acetyltransferase
MKFRRVEKKDFDETSRLFTLCLTDLLERENLIEKELLETEIFRLQQTVQESFSNPAAPFFVAEKNGQIAGTIALNKPGPVIASAIDVKPGSLEVACVYVHPEFQRQGVGTFLFQQVLQQLNQAGHCRYYLDAGFSSSQRYWLKRLGAPSRVLKDYWGPGKHHLIWQQEL